MPLEIATAQGSATIRERPDGRRFLIVRADDDAAWTDVLTEALAVTDGPVHLTIPATAFGRIDAARALGFVDELRGRQFDVPFEPCLADAGRVPRSTRVALRLADEINPDELFELDTELRGETPGSDGWRGMREWFDEELDSAEFDPSGYLVAVSVTDGALAGLVRFWRNDPVPSLGLLGVRAAWRHGTVAATLLGGGLRAASTWGADHFEVHTTRPALIRRLRRLGATEGEGFLRLHRPSPSAV